MIAKHTIVAVACAGAAVALMSGCSQATEAPAAGADAQTTAAPDAAPATGASDAATTLGTRETALGTVLTDGDGFTLYRFDEDTADLVRCVGPCAEIWPPTPGTPLPHPDAVLPGTVGTTTRPDGVEQATYDGHPLYRFAKDSAPGLTSGDGVKGTWHVVTVDAAHG
ncbi:COG4315 family predicted lipoprotein [Rhodococcus koreensis]